MLRDIVNSDPLKTLNLLLKIVTSINMFFFKNKELLATETEKNVRQVYNSELLA